MWSVTQTIIASSVWLTRAVAVYGYHTRYLLGMCYVQYSSDGSPHRER